MNDAEAIKVLIVNEHGQYLAGTASHWEFTEDRWRARVFDFHKDSVREQLGLVRKTFGLIWIAVKLDLSETHELCDRCATRMSALNTVFDGAQFLCRECVAQANAPIRNQVADTRPAIRPIPHRRHNANAELQFLSCVVPSVGDEP
jgi:hypothetical protein